MKKIFLALSACFMITVSWPVAAQSFTTVDPGFDQCHHPATAWVDLDNDGDLDIFIAGEDESTLPQFHIYRNDGGDNFIEMYPAITGVIYAACAFGDMNNDGLADLALCGYDGSDNITKVYRNDGGFQFTDVSAGIVGVSQGDLAWLDYDRDGLSDLLVSGMDGSGYPVTKLYRNDGGNTFSDSFQTLAGLYESSMATCDLDHDEDIDIAICGKDSLDAAKTYIYVNEEGLYSEMGAGVAGSWGGMLDWGDYNNDGFADLVISGSDDSNASQSYVYKSNNGTSFAQLSGPFSTASEGSAFWGDFDNDGLLDFVIAGRYRSGVNPLPPPDDPFMNIYYNQGGDQFQEAQLTLAVPANNEICCGDYDNDSDLDFLLAGSFVNPISGANDHTVIFKNLTGNVNAPPAAPADLSYFVSGNDLVFQWTASSDDHTPADGLNYNFRLGSQADNMDMFSALADLGDGYRRVAAIGNVGPGNELTVYGIPFGEYYASVQAIDASFAGSLFSSDASVMFLPTASFAVLDTACTEELVNITYTGNASAAAQYDWNFDGAVILAGSGQGPYVLYWDNEGTKTVSLTVIENGMTSLPVSHDVEIIDPVSASGMVTGNTEFCQGTDSTEYIVSPIAGAEYYQWELDPPDAGEILGSGLVATVAWNPDFAGIAVISASGVNFCGPGPASDMLEVTVQPKPGVPGTPEGPAELCRNPENCSYNTSGAISGLSYIWELIPAEAGSITGNGLQAEVDWNDTYTGPAGMFVTSENTCGAGPSSDTLDILIQIPPVANAGEDQVIEYQTATQLQGAASGGSGSYSYYWTPEGLLVDPAIADPQTIMLELSVQFTLTVTDELSGCAAEDQVIVTVTGGPLSVDALADPAEICEGDSTHLLALASGGSGAYNYSWSSDPPGFNSSVPDPSASLTENTLFYVEVDDGTDTATDSVEVLVSPLPEVPGSIGGPMTVCAGDANVLYEIDPATNATYYIWSLTDGIYGSSDSTSILISFSDPFTAGEGIISVMAANECGQSADSAFAVVGVESVPGKPQLTAGVDSLCTTTDTVVNYTIDNAVPLATHYEWQVLPEEAGYILGDGLEAMMHWVKNWEGEAALIVRAINDCGYSEWSDPYSVITYSCVGIFEADGQGVEVKLYPNPADEILNIEYILLKEDQNLELEIYDIYGRAVAHIRLSGKSGTLQLDTQQLPSGLYIANFYTGEEILGVKKIIISR